jgi:hypothetical protein
LAPFAARASIYIPIEELAARGPVLPAFMLFASSNARVVTVLGSKRLLVVLVPLHKNSSKLTSLSSIPGLIVKS